jgi:peptidoglycan/xylan/chitin deacetylase (PgdA/CDA1 family)
MFSKSACTLAVILLVSIYPVFGAPRDIHRRGGLAKVITSCTKPKVAALTFDDGPWIYGYDVSKALVAAGAKGTFFINGNNYECIYNADEVKRVQYIYSHGHQIASHTWAHLHLTTLSPSKLASEFANTDLAIQRILGVTPAFMRPPYGEYNDAVRAQAFNRSQTMVTWDFDSRDSDGATPEQSKANYDNVISEKPDNILTLNHETEEKTVHVVLPYAIKKLQASGYELVTVAECLGMAPYHPQVTAPQTGPFSC